MEERRKMFTFISKIKERRSESRKLKKSFATLAKAREQFLNSPEGRALAEQQAEEARRALRAVEEEKAKLKKYTETLEQVTERLSQLS